MTPDFGAAALKGSDEQRDLSCNLRSRKLSRSGESHSIPEQPHSNQPVQSGLVSAFANPQPGTYGSAPRALEVRGPMRLDESFAFKQTKIGERLINQFRVEIQNPLNRVVFGNPIMDFTNAAFGRINSTAVGPRNIQLGMKLIF